MSVKQSRGKNQPSLELRPFDRLTLALIGLGVIFASLGLGEAVYRLAFSDFDGATDRLPINLIWDRNHKIRHAVEAIAPVPYPGHQQAIRVIREEVDRIEWALADIMPR